MYGRRASESVQARRGGGWVRAWLGSGALLARSSLRSAGADLSQGLRWKCEGASEWGRGRTGVRTCSVVCVRVCLSEAFMWAAGANTTGREGSCRLEGCGMSWSVEEIGGAMPAACCADVAVGGAARAGWSRSIQTDNPCYSGCKGLRRRLARDPRWPWCALMVCGAGRGGAYACVRGLVTLAMVRCRVANLLGVLGHRALRRVSSVDVNERRMGSENEKQKAFFAYKSCVCSFFFKILLFCSRARSSIDY
jgi:hypothetical protein